MKFTVQSLKRLGLSQKERQILLWVFITSFILSACSVGAVWILSRTRQRNAASQLHTLSAAGNSNSSLLPVDMEAHRYAAKHFASTDQPLKAIPHYIRILENNPGEKESSLSLATAYMEGGLFRESIILFEKLLQNDNNDSIDGLVKARYGMALFHGNRTEESINNLRRCMEENPKNVEAACFLGQIEATVKPGSPLAARYFMDALEIDSTYTEAWYQFARYIMNKPDCKRGDYVTARDYLLRVLANEPLNAKAHSRLGMCYYYLQQPSAAQKSYETSLALNPYDYNTYYNLGELFYAVFNNTAEALRAFKHTVELKEDHISANFRIGMISLGNNMLREAVHYLEKAHTSDQDNIRILLQLAVAYERLGKYEETMQSYRKVLRIDALDDIAKHKLLLLQNRIN